MNRGESSGRSLSPLNDLGGGNEAIASLCAEMGGKIIRLAILIEEI